MEQELTLTQEPNEQREQSGACSNFAESRERKSEAQWAKVFPQSDKAEHSKITFHNRYGITLVADMYTPMAAIEREKSELASISEREQARPKVKGANGKLPAIAVSGPFGAVHTALYDDSAGVIPYDKMSEFFAQYLK